MSFISITNTNNENLDTYFIERQTYGTSTTGLTNYLINTGTPPVEVPTDLINYYYKVGKNGTIYNSNLKYKETLFTFSSGSESIDISNLFQLNLINSATNVTYDTIDITNGVIIKITAGSSNNITFNFPIKIADILIVAGGGGGGNTNTNNDTAGGGGGAGQVGVINWSDISENTITFRRIGNIIIGAGGAGGTPGVTLAQRGSNTSMRITTSDTTNPLFTCYGGGGGGNGQNNSLTTLGGSCGGSGASGESQNFLPPGGFNDTDSGSAGTINYIDYFAKNGGHGELDLFFIFNNPVGPDLKSGGKGSGGGGGGATADGTFNGGAGYTWHNNIIVGGGGGGGSGSSGIRLGGSGGGGNGGRGVDAESGEANTGGGGGGAPNYNTTPVFAGSRIGGAGGSGVIYIRILQSYVNL